MNAPALRTALLFILLSGAVSILHAEESVKELLAKLEADDFAQREAAQNKLRARGERVLPDLTKAAETARTPDLHARLAALIVAIQDDEQKARLAAGRKRATMQSYPISDLLTQDENPSRPSLGFGEGYGIGTRYWGGNGLGAVNTETKLLETLRLMVDPGGWENGRNTAAILQGSLLVNAGPEIHQNVADFLRALRTNNGGQVEVQSLLLQVPTALEGRTLTDAALDALLKDAPKDAVLLRSRLLGSNYRQMVVLEGRQFEYVPETVVAATEGGGIVGGVRAQQCLEGYAISYFPKWDRTRNEMGLTVTFYRNTNLNMRKINASEKWILERNVVVGKDEKGAAAPIKQGAVPDEEKKPWAFPTADLQTLHTDVIIPRGQWLKVGQLTGVKNDEKPAKEGLIYLLIKADGIEAEK